jgi:hypothetical protein
MPLHFPVPSVVRAGATKTEPFTVLIVANPALEAPWKSGMFVADPITAQQPAFAAAVSYIVDALFGALPGQAEAPLADPSIAPAVRVLSLFQAALPAVDRHAFAAQDGASNLLVARRNAIRDMLQDEGILADVVYAVSGSATHTRASAWHTTDDTTRASIPFRLNGATLQHCRYYGIPGTVALPAGSTSLTAAHEFQHAISSYQNGMIVDLYVDSPAGLNIRVRGAPGGTIPPGPFGVLAPVSHQPDPTRGPLGYPVNWRSFHCALHDPANPAIMDNYWLAPGGNPASCANDTITRQFIRDRVLAKLGR